MAARRNKVLPLSEIPVMARQGQAVGLLGGSFNPAHGGHLHVSLWALRKLKLDAVWWLVSPHNPLKQKSDLADYNERLQGARKAARFPRLRVLDFEQRRGTRYTIDTIRLLKRRYPHLRFVWLMGADNLVQFHRWRRWRDIARLVPIAVIDRAPYSHRSLRTQAALALSSRRLPGARAAELAASPRPAWVFLHVRHDHNSGSALRKKAWKKGKIAA